LTIKPKSISPFQLLFPYHDNPSSLLQQQTLSFLANKNIQPNPAANNTLQFFIDLLQT
jgi:hypothetical protein